MYVCVCINHCKKVTPIGMAPCEWLWHFMLQFYGLWTLHGVEVLKWENCVYSMLYRQERAQCDRNRMCSVESADGFIFTECISSERRPNFSHHRSIVYSFVTRRLWITLPQNGAGQYLSFIWAPRGCSYSGPQQWLMSISMDLCWKNKLHKNSWTFCSQIITRLHIIHRQEQQSAQ